MVLDAVRECVLAVGVRRTTLTDVAKRAGVSRMTLYRRYRDVDALIQDLLVREFGAMIRAARDSARGGVHARARLVATAAGVAGRIRRDELVRRIVGVDPELILPYLLDRLGGPQRIAVAAFADAIAAGQGDGSVRPGDPQQLAHVVLLLVQPFGISAGAVTGTLTEADLDRELKAALDGYLRP
jgi:AcrR family transcriptional regulator